MKKIIALIVLSVALLSAGTVKITDGYVKKAQKSFNSAMFITIKNSGNRDITIVKVMSGVSKSVQLHTMKMVKDIMKMKKIDNIVVKANSTLNFKVSGYHIMLIGLKKNLDTGNDVKATLILKDGKKINFSVKVKSYE